MTDINILALINNVAKDATNVAQKTYMDKTWDKTTDKSNSFNNVLETANKTFSSGALNSQNKSTASSTSSANDFNNVSYNKTSEKKQTEKTKDFNDNKNKVSDNDNIHKNTDEVNNKNKDKVERKNEDNTNKKEDHNQDSETNKVSDKDEKTQDKIDEKTINQSNLDKATASEQAVAGALAALAKTDKTEVSTTEDKVEDSTASIEKTSKGEIFEVDLTKAAKLPKEVDALKAQQNKAKVQPQTQQAIFNIKIASQDGTSTDGVSTDAQNSMMIQSDVNASGATNLNPNKQSLKDMLEKSALSQDILDKTNARITSVTTSGSAGGNLLNQQGAQEQGVKLSIEGTSNISGATGSVGQTTFDKTIENVQQPKELSKTDILAQIHTKLDDFKDESTTRVTIVLKPESLGKINLELINGKDGLTARMTTESAQVKELLDKNINELSSTLGKQGINVNNVSIKVAETQDASNGMLNFNQQQFQEGNQQASSNNSQNQSEQRGSAFEENATTTTTGSEEIAQNASTHDGQVDYKI